MSTATVFSPLAVGAGAAGTVVGRRDHLRLVVADERRAQPVPLHITRRGRLALTGTVALVLVLAFASLLSALGPAGASSAVVVEPGMTLTQLATEHLPEMPLSQAVTDIQRANKLSTTDIAVGQELVIPGR
ncbi:MULTISPECIES: LysM peptidoglycan-binding domain-containing protein [unclassified Ornithinimicrobium]|uniref:LysM peptidoglycan-binding domain-containing protein n=1 Tax=unclassified Ornithinimicrobium TaxID=2615080 RepID=UPI003851A50F